VWERSAGRAGLICVCRQESSKEGAARARLCSVQSTNVPVRLGCHVRGVPAIQSSASCHSAPQGASGTLAASGRDHHGRLAVGPCPCTGDMQPSMSPCRKATCLSATSLPLSSQRALCLSTLTLMLTLSSLSPRSPITAIRRPVDEMRVTPGSRAVCRPGVLP